MVEVRKKMLTGAAIVALCSAVGVGGGLLGCAPQGAGTSEANGVSEASTGENGTVKTMEQWGELYPLQYSSYAVTDIKSDGQYHSHYDLKQKMLAPVDRKVRTDGQLDTKLLTDGETGYNDDGNLTVSGLWYDSESGHWVVDEGEYGDLSGTRERQGCYACKSSLFEDEYDRNGAEIFGAKLTDGFVDSMNGQVWNCGVCHDGDPAMSTPDAQLTYWTQLARDTFDTFDSNERVCGQCHNSLDYRSHITDQKAMDSFSPYQYGLDIDSLYEAAVEDGVYSIDEDTGILLTCFDHPEVEFVQGSAMRELGVTCVDCHMAETVDGTSGTVYTMHNASGSPLENEEALEYCLTCHKSQGIESTDDMARMVRNLQEETTAIEEQLKQKFDTAYDLIKSANQNGGAEESLLQQARDDYSLAEAYFHAVCGDVGDEPLGTKVVHNPTATADYNAKTGKLLDGIIQSLS